MTDPEIRRAMEICERFPSVRVWRAQVHNPSTGYAATLRALLEAREMLRETIGDHASDVMGEPCELCPKISAFLAEGESK